MGDDFKPCWSCTVNEATGSDNLCNDCRAAAIKIVEDLKKKDDKKDDKKGKK